MLHKIQKCEGVGALGRTAEDFKLKIIALIIKFRN